MAISRLSVKVGKRGYAAAHASYVTRTGDYSRLRQGERLDAIESGNMPTWAVDPLTFWRASDDHERANGSAYREFEIALPRELTKDQRLALVKKFVEQEIGKKHAYTFGIHCSEAEDGGENPHVHLMFSERMIDGIDRDPDQYFKRHNSKAPEKGGLKKGWGEAPGKTLTQKERADELKRLRERWEHLCNAALNDAGHSEKIDMRSYKDQGLAIPRVVKLPLRNAQQHEDMLSARAARASAVKAAKEARAAMAELARIDFAAELEKLKPAPVAATAKLPGADELIAIHEATFSPAVAPTPRPRADAPETPPPPPAQGRQAAGAIPSASELAALFDATFGPAPAPNSAPGATRRKKPGSMGLEGLEDDENGATMR